MMTEPDCEQCFRVAARAEVSASRDCVELKCIVAVALWLCGCEMCQGKCNRFVSVGFLKTPELD